MQSQRLSFSSSTGMIASLALLVLFTSCQPAKNINSNANTNANANSSANTNTNSSSETGSSINTREPEKYSGTMILSLETEGGEKAIGIPTLTILVARSGEDRRIEFKLPDGSPLVYLDHENRHYVILPARKQYAELSKEATGVQLNKVLTPGQLVADLKSKTGVERVGEAPLNGRTTEKYRYAATKNTNTKAGEVKAEAFIYIDKETGLPLRAEMLIESSGEVKGVKAARAVTEMRDLKTDVDPSIFQTPAGYEQIAPEKIRQHITALTQAVEAILRAMMAGASGASPSPTASATPQK